MSPTNNNSSCSSSSSSAAATAAQAEIIDIRTTKHSNTTENLVRFIHDAVSTKNIPFNPATSIPKNKDNTSLKTTSSSYLATPPSEQLRLLRSIPTLVLYDNKGLDIFDKITYCEDYYLTNAEIDIFKRHAQEMVQNYMQDGSVIIELGVGAMRKTKFILQEIVKQQKSVTYYGVDLDEQSLKDCLGPSAEMFPSIKFVGLYGTYLDSLSWINANIPSTSTTSKKLFLWLGSSIGNMNRTEAGEFLHTVCQEAMQPGDLFFCGIDRRNAPEVIQLAYDDSQHLTRDFIMNGLTHCNRIFKSNVFDETAFEYVSIYNTVEGRHEAYYKSLKDQSLNFSATSSSSSALAPVSIAKDELINVEYSYKYNSLEVKQLIQDAKFSHVARFTDSSCRYDMQVFQKPPFFFAKPVGGDEDGSTEVPNQSEFAELWKAWDVVTTQMITDHSEKPIALRHPFIFYLGHIPAFLDIMVSKALDEPHTNPVYSDIFERGIDPDMEDGSCHSHSRVPTSWPTVDEVLAYRDLVRERVSKVLTLKQHPHKLSHALWMSFEHECMHLETILYMLVQSSTAAAPHNVVMPRLPSSTIIKAASLVTFAQEVVTIGMSSSSSSSSSSQGGDEWNVVDGASGVFGWDNEMPARAVSVPSFQIQDRPITVGEYAEFLSSTNSCLDNNDSNDTKDLVPASWARQGMSGVVMQDYAVKTVFGLVPLSRMALTPVFCSGAQASAYADAKGMRLPTEGEMQIVRNATSSSTRISSSWNVGFSQWMPMPVVADRGIMDDDVLKCDGHGWEWTSSVFSSHDGFIASVAYPGYSADFFDGKHLVVAGRGSWATHPRIACRRSFRNWYQAGYPYVFATFRCCV